jgi:DNA-binding TFAR19-related protein (PDSD5 family)
MSVHAFFWAYLKKIINSKQDERSEHWIVKNHLFCFVCLNMIKIIAFMNQLKHKIIDLTMVKFTPQIKKKKERNTSFFHT